MEIQGHREPDTTAKNGRNIIDQCSLPALVKAAHMSGQPHQKLQELDADSTIIDKNGGQVILEDEMKRLCIDQDVSEQKTSHQTAAQTVSEKERDRLRRRKWKCPVPFQKYGPGSPYFHGSDPLYTADTTEKYGSGSYYHGSEPLYTSHISFSCTPQHDSDNISCIVLSENPSNFPCSPQQDSSNISWNVLSESLDSSLSVNPPRCELHRLRSHVVRSRSPVHVDDHPDGREAELAREQMEVLMVMGFKSFFSNKSWWNGSTLR